jgi:uncharacterized membrane protein
MKRLDKYVLDTSAVGLIFIIPLYIALLVLAKAMKGLFVLIAPLASMLPAWLPGGQLLSLLIFAVVCFLIGALIQSPRGRATRERVENKMFSRIPGYDLFRGLTQRVTGQTNDQTWKPALAEIEEALVPAFIVEELQDGRLTVFVPSVPTPLAGAVYILTPDRVHPLEIPFTQAVAVVSHWGSGSQKLVAAMETNGSGMRHEVHHPALEPVAH